ncbi:nitrilase-related carbon-nitrogen hydrolase [Actinotalea sp. Marseille-Q4924]|uniref:nitrilase-related carbon-nitrogen hydrolase n=1 Tax=Actinotalea sp. Marseille-Q4924 TaxID=2866571 RepID=UPI001CE40665|nr:nitrilase-related carbon-nitrogen hydrolase [Actinotalea sp. Marseille-Q4924]
MSVRAHAVAFSSGRDVGANRAAAVAAVESAAEDGAALVVLPEYAALFDPSGVPPELAEPLDGPFVTALREASSRTGVTVVAGTCVPGSRPDRAQNAVVVVAGGEVVGDYRKVHLYDAFGHRESDRLEAGAADADAVVVEVGSLRVGVMTCYDLRFPEAARRLVDAGADVLVVPAAWAWGEHKADHWLTLLRARAIENTAYVVAAAQQGHGVTGASVVVDPLGVVLADAGAPEREPAPATGLLGGAPSGAASPTAPAAVADLRPEHVAAVREKNPSLRNRRYRVVPA